MTTPLPPSGEAPRARRKRLRGIVVSAGRMAKTVTVEVERYPWHPRIGKQLRRVRRALVHDPVGLAQQGDRVIIEETRPLSKRKHFRILSVEKVSREAGEKKS